MIFLKFVLLCVHSYGVSCSLDVQQFPLDPKTGFEHCHTIIVDRGQKNEGTLHHLETGWQDTSIMRLSGRSDTFDLVFFKLRKTWWQGKATCVLIYILDASPDEEHCRIQSKFAWLVDCNMASLNPTCYGHHVYYISISFGVPRLQIANKSPLNFCHGDPLQPRASHLLPHYEYVTLNSTFELVTKLLFPCHGSIMRTTYDLRQIQTLYGQDLLPSRALLDSKLQELIFHGCPMHWAFKYGLDSHMYGVLNTGFYGKGRGTTWRTMNIAEETAIDVIKVFNQSHSRHSHSTSFKFVSPTVLPVFLRPYGVPRSENNSMDYMYIYLLNRRSFNFLTCGGTKEYLSFKSFLQPFKFKLWIVALTSVVIIWLFLWLTFRIRKILDDSAILILKIFLDQGLDLSSKLRNLPGLRVSLTGFLFAAILLIDLYRGTVTTNMTAPLPRTQLKTIHEALGKGFKTLVGIERNKRIGKNGRSNDREVEKYLKEPSSVDVKWNLISTTLAMGENVFINAIKEDLRDYSVDPTLMASLAPILWNENTTSLPVHREILKCENTMFVDFPEALDAFRLSASNLNPIGAQNLYYGTDDFMPRNIYWIITPTLFDRNGIIHTRFQTMLHSGVFQKQHFGVHTDHYIGQKMVKKLLAHQNLKKVDSLSWKSGLLRCIYIIYFACFALSVSVFGFEYFVILTRKTLSHTRVTGFQ